MNSTSSSSSYGRACAACSKNKSKCVTRDAGARCERLVRLDPLGGQLTVNP